MEENKIQVVVAGPEHEVYVDTILQTIADAAKVRGTGIAKRTHEYLATKMKEAKAVIALSGDRFAGFSYIETWGNKQYVTTSGLIVHPDFRGLGVAKKIKDMTFSLARTRWPHAKIFSLTSGAAVMKMNTELGYQPVTFADLTDDEAFWRGCEGCVNVDVLHRTGRKYCICTAMLYDPEEHLPAKIPAFSGGLDTSYTVMKLTQDGWDVYAACANTGGFSAEQLKTNEENAYKLGAKAYVTLDVTQEYYEKSLKYMIFGNVLRNNCYPISVSSERIFQAIAIARYAKEIGADAIAHGSTGAGNDQIRFDMTFLVMAPGVEIITLTRDKKLTRKEEVDFLNEHGFFADFTKLKYSYNVGIWGTSICGGELLDPTQGLPEEAYLKHVTNPEKESLLKIEFEKGEIVGVNGEKFTDRVKAIQKIEEIGASYAIGRDANVGDTIIGIKGRVGFEAAAPKLIIEAHRLLEKSTLSKWQQYWKDQVANWYGMFLHESQYLEPVMPDIEAMLTSSQRNVTGTAILKLRPYGFETVGIDSANDLTKSKLGEYGETQTGWTADEAKGFIKVSSTPLRVYYGIHPNER